jgi:hypothetical protein
METREKAILVAGLVVAIGFFVILHDPYLAGITVILVIALAVAFQIMNETRSLPPRLTCWLSEDARSIILRNEGNERAVRIHITLVPQDLQFDLPELAVEGRHEFPLPSMLAEVKAVVSYEDASGRQFSRSILLSSTGKGEEDLLKPAFPLFGWK